MTLAIQLCTLSSYGFSLLKSFIAINPLASAAGIYRTHRFPKLHRKKKVSIFKNNCPMSIPLPLLLFQKRNKLISFSPGVPGYIWRASCHPPRRFFLTNGGRCLSLFPSAPRASHLNPVLNHQTKSEFTAVLNRSSHPNIVFPSHYSRPKMPMAPWPLYSKSCIQMSGCECFQVNIRRWLTQENPMETECHSILHGGPTPSEFACRKPLTFKPCLCLKAI